MSSTKRLLLLSSMLFLVRTSFSQVSQAVQKLEDYCKQNTAEGYSPRFNKLTLVPRGNLHYLFPFYHAFHDEAKFRNLYTDKGYYKELSEYFAFAGDYPTALQYLQKSFDSIDDATRRKVFRKADGLKNIVHVDAKTYINFQAKAYRVIMINESNSKPLHRAFTLSLLGDLYRRGFRYLAMEMLDNFPDHSLTKETMRTGYYASEPVAGELVRTALAMGYKLVSYEDTAAYRHTENERDSIQAANLLTIVREDSSAKILVHGSYARISKKILPDGDIPMGLRFKQFSGLDPLTIDQTEMTEGGNMSYGSAIYDAYVQKFPIKSPSIALSENEPVSITNNDLFDLYVIHPLTRYQDGRPNWLNLGDLRQAVYVKPSSPDVFLVQAYYASEITANEDRPWQLVPADQTYVQGGKKNYLLYLKKGSYKVYFRDINYHILNILAIEVS